MKNEENKDKEIYLQSKKSAEMVFELIVATDENGVIGIDGEIPWKCRSELKLFREKTLNKKIIVGRGTWDERFFPLKGRENLLISGTINPEGAKVYSDPETLLQDIYPSSEPIMVIGGAKVYRYFIEKGLIDTIHLSVMKLKVAISESLIYFPFPIKITNGIIVLTGDAGKEYSFEITDTRDEKEFTHYTARSERERVNISFH